jgi:hypothetical protein
MSWLARGAVIAVVAIVITGLSVPGATASRQNDRTCGRSWAVVPSPNPGNFYNILKAVSADSASDAWAIGHYGNQNFNDHPLSVHWDGVSWQQVPILPGLGSNNLTGVAAISPTDAWAVGWKNQAGTIVTISVHWNGTQWSMVPTPNPQSADTSIFSSVSAMGADDVWAVGRYNDDTGRFPLAEHWDGSSWSIVPMQTAPGFDELRAVHARSSADAWAVGNGSIGLKSQTLIEHWDGASWSVIPSPSRAGQNVLFAVHALSATDAWAVGEARKSQSFNDIKPISLHWDGASWTLASTPSGDKTAQLEGVTAGANGTVWAVGEHWSSPGAKDTLIEKWTGSAWTIVPSPSPSAGQDYLLSVTQAAGHLWAVGVSYSPKPNGLGRSLIEEACP